MIITTYTVNESGLNEIAAFIRENHKDGSRISEDASCISAWASEAEESMDNGNAPMIEIRSWDHVKGYTATFTVSDAGIDATTEEVDN